MKTRFTETRRISVVIAALLAMPALAQEGATPAAVGAGEVEEIVVTGTFLRGIATSSVQPIDLSQAEVAASGALTTPQVLANIPQLAEFNTIPAVAGSNNVQVNINRVNLRDLPGSGGGSSTLVLLDGHRIAGAGIKSTAPDPDVLPPSVIERVEAVPDGGSSIYGADAVGGVLNLIPRKRFDGVQIDARLGGADDYEQSDYGLMVGKDWGSGSAYVAYNRLDHDAIFGRDRDYVENVNAATGLGAEANCAGNVTLLNTGERFVVADASLATGRTFCDRSGFRTIYPKEERDSVFASVTQQLGDSVTFDLHGYYARRENESDEGPRATSVAIRPVTALGTVNPFFRPAPGAASPNSPQSVQVVFTPFGTSTIDRARNETWGVSPSLSVDLPRDWQLRALLNYGRTDTEVANPQINAVQLGTLAALGQFNPYDVEANSPAVLAAIGNFEIYGQADHELSNARAVLDGPVFMLPGGELSAAFGFEYVREEYAARTGNAVPGQEVATLTRFPSRRNTKAAFAELNVPIVGDPNRRAGIDSLTVSLSTRYDDYSDFGNSTNPTVGIIYEPVSWITLRGRWGTSFQAPSLADTAAADNAISQFPSNIIVSPFQPPTATQTIEFAFQGGLPGIRPQEADIFSIGFEVAPPLIPGLKVGATYYDIKYDGIVSIPPVFLASQFFTQFTDLFQLAPLTQEQIADFLNSAPNAAQNLATVASRGGPAAVYALLDARRRNLGSAEVSGIDLATRYSRAVGFGSVFAGLNGTYRLQDEQSANAGAPLVSQVDQQSRLRYTFSLGANIGSNLLAQATLLSSGGFDVTPSVQNSFQRRVSSFQTVNLFFQYDMNGTGLTEDLTFSLSVNNVLDEDPPEFQGVFNNLTFGYANGGTVGQLFQLGVSKKF